MAGRNDFYSNPLASWPKLIIIKHLCGISYVQVLYNHLLFIPHNVRKPQIKGRDKVNTILLNKRGVPSSRLSYNQGVWPHRREKTWELLFYFLFVLQFILLISIKSGDPAHLGEPLGAWRQGVPTQRGPASESVLYIPGPFPPSLSPSFSHFYSPLPCSFTPPFFLSVF